MLLPSRTCTSPFPPGDAGVCGAISPDDFSVSVLFGGSAATLRLDGARGRLFLQRRGAAVVDVAAAAVVNVESAGERRRRRVRCARLAAAFPEAFAKEANAARAHSRQSTAASASGLFGESVSPISAMDDALSARSNGRGEGDAVAKDTATFFLHFVSGSGKDSGVSVRTVEFASPPSAEAHVSVCRAVHCLVRTIYRNGVRKLVFFVSPKSGSGQALRICTKKIFPVLQFARHELEVIVTTRAGHCEDYIADVANSLDSHCVIVIVGGDGILHEAVNGIHRRRAAAIYAKEQKEQEAEDRANQKLPEESLLSSLRRTRNGNSDQKQSDCSLPSVEKRSFVSPVASALAVDSRLDTSADFAPLLATIAAGSGCGMATSLDVLTFRKATLALVHLDTCVKDLMSLQCNHTGNLVHTHHNGTRGASTHCKSSSLHSANSELSHRIAFMSVSFGAPNEVDHGSEKLRWMGNARFTTYVAYKLLRGFRARRAKLRYIPWKGVGGRQLNKICSGDAMPSEAEFPPCTMDLTCAHCRAHGAGETDAQNNTHTKSPREPIDFDDPSLPWVTLDGDFYCIFIGNLRDATRDVMFAPLAHLSDGAVDLVYSKLGAKRQKRRDFFNFFTRLEKGKHVDLPFVSYVKAAAVELTAFDTSIMADGEVLPFKNVRVVPLRCAAQFVRSSLNS